MVACEVVLEIGAAKTDCCGERAGDGGKVRMVEGDGVDGGNCPFPDELVLRAWKVGSGEEKVGGRKEY